MKRKELTLQDGTTEHSLSASAKDDCFAAKLKNQALWLGVFGLLNIVLPWFSAPFGVMLLFLGLAIYYFPLPAMYAVLSVVFISTAISNFLVGITGVAYATPVIVLLIFATRVMVKEYRSHRRQGSIEAGSRFAWTGLVLGLMAPGGVLLAFVLSTVAVVVGSVILETVSIFVFDLMLEIGVMVLGMGTAAVLEGYRPKIVSWIALLLGLLLVIAQYVLLLRLL